MRSRNRAFFAEVILDIILIAAGILACRLTSWEPWIIVGACGLLMLAAHVFFLRRRYAAIARLADRIDRILHGQEQALISESEEGELAVLSSEIRKMTVRLSEQASQLQEDKVFLAEAMEDVAHQLRTPLTSMGLVMQMLSKETLSSDRRMELMRDLRTNQEKISWLVETQLKLSKIDAGTAVFTPQTVAARTLLVQAVQPLAIPFELRGIGLVMKSDGSSLSVDPAWTQEAVANIVKNCMEHMKDGGKLRLTAQTTALYTEFLIEDSGEGFAEEDLPHIFERYYRGKNAAPDSIGIGLALSRMIITEQGGTVTAENRREGGARFVIRFYKSTL